MKITARILVFGALFASIASVAFADPIDGVVNVSGGAAFTPTSLTFIQPFASTGDTGIASTFSGGNVNYLLGTVAYNDPILGGSIEVFTITDANGNLLAFFDSNNGVTSGTNPSSGLWNINLDETGYYTMDGGAEMPGYFDLTLAGDSAYGSNATTFAGSGGLSGTANLRSLTDPISNALAIAPEPASFLLLATGLLGLAGLFKLRRREFQRAV